MVREVVTPPRNNADYFVNVFSGTPAGGWPIGIQRFNFFAH